MQVRIIAVGRLKAGPERELAGRYIDRFEKSGRAIGLSGADIVEIPESRAATSRLRRDQEGEAILRALARADGWFLLDERGDDQTSDGFAQGLRAAQDRAAGQLAFVIGGADGVGVAVRDAAPHAIRFGKMTWPHQMVRILLCEQLYRAVTILTGHPYHRGG